MDAFNDKGNAPGPVFARADIAYAVALNQLTRNLELAILMTVESVQVAKSLDMNSTAATLATIAKDISQIGSHATRALALLVRGDD
jgi:hypothetical protein